MPRREPPPAALPPRRCVLLEGTAAAGRAAASMLLAEFAAPRCLWLGAEPPAGFDRGPAAAVLGQEFDALVLDAHAGFDPDACGQAAGTLRAGGVLLLLTPPLADWPRFADPEHQRIAVHPLSAAEVSGRFLGRLARLLAADSRVERRHAEAPGAALRPPVPRPAASPALCATADQASAVAALVRTARGRARRPLVLAADRGRGKSAALGLAAAVLLASGKTRIVVSGPRLDATQAVFTHAAAALPAAQATRGRLELDGRVLEFIAPDALAEATQPADFVMVDEAAALPLALLERLLARWPRLAFASTVHGYEGSGRGFALRFRRTLDARTPEWRALTLETPVRWAAGDPLEALLARLLLLDAEPVDAALIAEAQPAALAIQRLDRADLAADDALLDEVFGLLVLAHYRTTPLDLRHLLDGPNLAVWVARHDGHVVAVALAAREGGFSPQLAAAVQAGQRRPRGHLLPQSLAYHLARPEAACLRAERIVRIAVHPAARGRGIGRALLAHIAAAAQADGVDLFGSSFAADPPLLAFWRGAGLLPVRAGFTRETASGAQAVLVLAALSAAGTASCAAARARFCQSLPYQLGDPLRELDPALALALLCDPEQPAPALEAARRAEIEAYVAGQRDYGSSVAVLWPACAQALASQAATRLDAAQAQLLLRKVLARDNWAELVRRCALPGRATAEQALRSAVGRLFAGV